MRVGARTTVLISAADSSDPDEDALTYAWSVGADCAAQVLGAANEVELQLADLSPDQACSVTLTVSDGRDEGSASAELIIRDVGAYVSTAQPCVDGYDATNDAPQGTIENPFCHLADALLAAADYQIALVSIEALGEQTVTEPLHIGRSVTIRGGYVRSDAGWTVLPVAPRSELALAPAGTLSIAGASASDTVKLENLTIFRTAACTADCALVDAVGTSVTISGVDFGTSPRAGVVVSAANADSVYYSVRAVGISSTASRQGLVLDSVSIKGAGTGLGSVGIAVGEALNATIANTTITEKSRTATGVQLLRAGSVSIEDSTIGVESDAATLDDAKESTSIAIGVRDGNTSTLGLGGCDTPEARTCGSSAGLAITNSFISAAKARLAISVLALGTRTLSFLSASTAARTRLVAVGRQAAGIVTMNTGDAPSNTRGLSASRVDIDVTASSSPGQPLSYAVGWSDGYELGQPDVTNALVGLGSHGAVVNDMHIGVHAGTEGIDETSGVVLRDTRDADITSLSTQVDSASTTLPVNGYAVARVAGVRLLRTANVTFTGGSATIGNVMGSWIVAGLIDGQMTLANDDIATGPDAASYGSTHVTVNNLALGGPLSVRKVGSGFPIRTCVGLFGSSEARVSSQNITCTLGASENETDPSMAGIITLFTRNVSVVESNVRLQATAVTAAVRLVGLQDGSRLAGNRGSTGLRVARNIIDLDARSRLSAGLRLSGAYTGLDPAARVATVIDDNFIRIAQSEANVGVLVYATPATIAFNNVRVATCTATACNDAWATAFYLMHPRPTDPVRILGNGFGVADGSFSEGASEATPLVVEHAMDVNVGVTAIVDNIHGRESPSGAIGLYTRFVNGNVAELRSPEGETPLTEAQLTSMSVSTVGNVDSAPTHCGDGLHGDPMGPQAGIVRHITAGMLDVPNLRDLDGEARTPADGDDAGADKLSLCLEI